MYDSMGIHWHTLGPISRAQAGSLTALAGPRGWMIWRDDTDGRTILRRSLRGYRTGSQSRTACAKVLHTMIAEGQIA